MAYAPLADAEGADDDLLVLVSDGDPDAFAVFYDHMAPRVFGIVKRVLVDPAQSEEVTQDVFLEAWQHASRFDPAKGTATSWLFTMAHRRAIDRVRASQSSRDRDLAVGVRDFEEARDDVAETIQTTVEHDRITRALRTLTAKQQQALELTYFQGLTHKEAAHLAGVPTGTMKSRIREALITLRIRVGVPDAS
nr:ECF RNA polymerase sigma factor SigK [Frondihabitans sp. PAMC 28766]